MDTKTARTPPTPSVLEDPMLNRGVGFTAAEREALGLTGRLPAAVLTLEQQVLHAAQVWLVDKQGLLTSDMADLRDYQRLYARTPEELKGWSSGGAISLLDAVRHVSPTILLGTSTANGAAQAVAGQDAMWRPAYPDQVS